jgi:hypothetical protein
MTKVSNGAKQTLIQPAFVDPKAVCGLKWAYRDMGSVEVAPKYDSLSLSIWSNQPLTAHACWQHAI